MRILHVLTFAAGLSALALPAAAQQNGATPGAAPAPERRICKIETETGSLARQRRRCYTAREWERLATGIQSSARDMVENNRGRPSENY